MGQGARPVHLVTLHLESWPLRHVMSEETMVRAPAPAPSSGTQLKQPAPTPSSGTQLKHPAPAPSSGTEFQHPAPTLSSGTQLQHPVPTLSLVTQLQHPAPTPSSGTQLQHPALPSHPASCSIPELWKRLGLLKLLPCTPESQAFLSSWPPRIGLGNWDFRFHMWTSPLHFRKDLLAGDCLSEAALNRPERQRTTERQPPFSWAQARTRHGPCTLLEPKLF